MTAKGWGEAKTVHILTLKKLDGTLFECPVHCLLNVGYAGRNREAVQKHIDELAEMGVAPPGQIPTVYPVSNYLAGTFEFIQVQHAETSGEIEYVLLIKEGNLYVTVGSDHSDRRLEVYGIPWAKQACPNIVAPEVWDFRTVAPHWDSLILRCWVLQDNLWHLYQEGALDKLIAPEGLLAIARDLVGNRQSGLCIFSGTIPAVEKMVCGDGYHLQLADPVLKREINHQYTVVQLPPPVE